VSRLSKAVAIVSLSAACAQDPKLQQLQAHVDAAQGSARHMLGVAGTPPESLAAVLRRVRQAEQARDTYLQKR
jgi:hypothetical protein